VLWAVLAAIALVLPMSLVVAQEKTVQVKTVTMTNTNPASGSEMYAEYCAVCHGTDGKGNGPAASAFKKAPTNLTVLAKNNNGKYPSEHVYYVLKFGTPVAAHGDVQMPVWNKAFQSLNQLDSDENMVTLRINNLVAYIKGIQAK
jgi:mono/diheme cytochrome c family protein